MLRRLLFFSLVSCAFLAFLVPAKADVLEKARNFMLYKRYDRAEELLREYTNSKPVKDKRLPYAYYLLVENFLLQKRSGDATKAAQEAMSKLPSAPFTMLALGGVLLYQNQEDEARPLFENALQQSKYKDSRIVSAYIRAYARSRYGNTDFVLNKIKDLPERFDKTSDFFTALADLYKRRREQNEVYKNYQQAILKDGNDLEARYKIGRFFLAQKNKEGFLENMEAIVEKDPHFAPAYYELYAYFYNKDVKKARDYFQLYKENTDIAPSVEFEELSILYASQEYKEAISKTKQYQQKHKAESDIRAYRLIAYSYSKLDNSDSAYVYLDSFLTQAEAKDPDLILATNYKLMGDLLSKKGGQSERAISFYQKSFILDTVIYEQKQVAEAIIELAKQEKNYPLIATWSGKIAHLHNPPVKQALFRWGVALEKAQQYSEADSVFSEYIRNYPDEYFGYYWSARSKMHTDTTLSSCAPLLQKAVTILDTSKDEKIAKSKPKLLSFCYNCLYSHAAEKLKDMDLAISYLDKLIELNPEKAQNFINAKEQLLNHIEKQKKYEEEMRKYEEKKRKYEMEKNKAKQGQ